jgi:carbamoylphosphate synthase small subunit
MGYGEQTAPRFHVVAYDFGVKKNILRMLAERGCKVTVVPAQTPAAEVLKHNPTAFSCPTALATRSLATTRLRPPRN